MADGQKVQRRFHKQDKVELVFGFLELKCGIDYTFTLSTNFPKQTISLAQKDSNIDQLGLFPQAILFVTKQE